METHAEQEKPHIPSSDDSGKNHDTTGSEVIFYEIHARGHLDGKWSEFFDGMQVKLLENGEMILFGPIIDQAALMGVLNKLGRLNLALISLCEVKNQLIKEKK